MDKTLEQRIEKIIIAKKEALRFIERAENLVDRLKEDEWAKYQCKESAAMKRASMDLTRALSEIRKTNRNIF